MTRSAASIETVSGIFVNIENPDISTIDINDIAWGLSREPRFGGHTASQEIYSVAQHSLVVAKIVEEAFRPESQIQKLAIEYFTDGNKDTSNSVYQLIKLNIRYKRIVTLLALLHDGSEAYLRDLPSPIKNIPSIRAAYGELESRMMTAIHTKYDLVPSAESEALIHWADIFARTIEAFHLMPSRGHSWSSQMNIPTPILLNFEFPKPQAEIRKLFLAEFERLNMQRKQRKFDVDQ